MLHRSQFCSISVLCNRNGSNAGDPVRWDTEIEELEEAYSWPLFSDSQWSEHPPEFALKDLDDMYSTE